MDPIYRILIVDDNEAAAESLGKLLEYRGHTVRLAHDGASVPKIADEYQPEVIILDIGLPDTEGYDVARGLRGAGSSATLIALTGYGQYEDREKAKEAGFDHHLTKPAGLRDVETILATLGKSAPLGAA
jgi:DNA-binding response OmpR family regulator